MYKKSFSEITKLYFVDFFVGTGIGVFVSIGLWLGKIIPDTLESTLMIVIPILVVYFILQFTRKYGKIEINNTGLSFSKRFGKPMLYSYSEYNIEATAKNYSFNYMHFACGLIILVTNKQTGKTKQLNAFGYNEATIQLIAQQLSSLQPN